MRFACRALWILCLVSVVAPCTTGCGGSASADAAGSTRPWEALPEDVVAIAHVDVASLLRSELYGSMGAEDRLPADTAAKLEQFEAATGFDWRTDLETITIGAAYAPSSTEGPFYVIARGAFDPARIERYARDQAEVTVESREGLTTYVSRPAGDAAAPASVAAFIDSSTMIVSRPNEFADFLRTVRGKSPSVGGSSLASLVSGSSGQLIVAIDVPAEARQALAESGASPEPGAPNMLAGLAEPLRHLQTVMLTLDVSHDFELALTTEADTPESGQLVHDTLQGFLAMGKMMSADRPETAELLSQARVEKQDRTVRLSIRLTREQVETAMRQRDGVAIAAGTGE